MKLWQDLKSSPIETIARWQNKRPLWIIMAVVMLSLIILAHSFFQNYLYMLPCEQCVYIRYSMFLMVIGGVIAAINPKEIVAKLIGYFLAIYGAVIGILFSVKLHGIHKAVHSDDPFAMMGMQGCSTDPHFYFLGIEVMLADKWPDWFKPTGDCGYDAPVVPTGVELNGIQTFFTDLYSNGWYLIPKFQFMDMSICTLLAYVVALVCLVAMLVSWIISTANDVMSD
ncbi:MAG: protein-disulfide oxidoreductase DsbI [Campylobacteraceae bacterium]|nr:protein-disulfide oxidoreductase DsbI [Campylobacteraceae bacterium]